MNFQQLRVLARTDGLSPGTSADLIDYAEKAEAALRDMEAARDEQTRMKMETCRALDKERDAAEAKVATARAVMAEEAARKSESYGEIGMRPAREIRALAPLPAGLVVLSVEVAKTSRELVAARLADVERLCAVYWREPTYEPRTERTKLTETLAALDAAGGETRHRNQPRACNCSWVLTGAHAQWCSTSDSNGGPR